MGGLAGGAIADRLGTRRVLLVSTTGMALGYGALGLVHAPAPAVTLLLVAGLFEAAFHPTIAALVAEVVPPGSPAPMPRYGPEPPPVGSQAHRSGPWPSPWRRRPCSGWSRCCSVRRRSRWP